MAVDKSVLLDGIERMTAHDIVIYDLCLFIAEDGETVYGEITQDCGACHNLLAMEEAAPKILNDLGLKP